MKTNNIYVLSLLAVVTFLTACTKPNIPQEKFIIYSENFDNSEFWSIYGEDHTYGVQQGVASGEVLDGALNLQATGCTEVMAYLPLADEVLTSERHENITVTVHILEFEATPVYSIYNNLEISFHNFILTILPKESLENIVLTFKMSRGKFELVDPVNAVDYVFSTNATHNRIGVNLKSEGDLDCSTASASWQIGSIKIFRK